MIEMAINIYTIKHYGKIPDSLEELLQPIKDSSKPLLEKEDIIDAWGELMRYEHDGNKYLIISSGPDRKMRTADDIVRGNSESYIESWKAKYVQAIAEQRTNATQEATAGTTQPPAGVEKTQTNRVPVTGTQSSPDPDNPPEPKTTPWKIALLIGLIATAGAIMAWRFRKKG